jgi:dTDP-4-dehydrorhamnose reductase
MKRILLTGITGQVGYPLQHLLTSVGQVIGVGRSQLDLSQPDAIRRTVEDVQPDLIVNAAAYTAVDKAETEFELATAINGTAPTVLATAAQEREIPIIHISTDYVFDGQKNTPYLETDATNPVNAYGRSKLMGEEGVLEHCDRAYIFRTAWVYGTHGHGNFVKTMLRLGAEREELRVVVDQVGAPTHARDLATAIQTFATALTLDPATAPAPGLYHYTNSGAISWYDFAIAIFEEAKLVGLPLNIQQVIPIATAEYPTPAKRPAYSVLSTKKVAAVLEHYPPHWRQSLREMLLELYTHREG